MEISGKKIAELMQKELRKEVVKLKKKKKNLQLTTFLIGQSTDQLSFVKIKAKVAKELGISFQLIHLKEIPLFEEFMHKLKSASQSDQVTGIIIQQPLPAQLSTESIYNYIPLEKEIEGHKYKSPFFSPIGLAVMTILKNIYIKGRSGSDVFFNPKKDRLLFKKIFHSKKVVLIGRGITGGAPVGHTLTEFKVNYIAINSKTPEPETYLKEADVIISCVGKKVIFPEMLKPQVVLINVGLRREKNRLLGDYDEKEIKDIASFYTPTPGGIGPIDVLYLYNNLIEAAKLQ
ncbi:bifunctional 5,10-methylenetetrahydrofolate dehydrogenase/5,10-methenyltetrahydrofolate cyclohydrolase [Candidatus Roizmanbacteria bacterium]|jgi:methylenetetrahydrofolate dehydrogenase (NADP+)/methenyltetrahydrofolate cyclohydrolase|nr:bifunctional 5,10-methylenetetrahydrofolate dehydrogenase/5,10-methenyltetrahydrofolate cyclohydrolase [Candidatus Roizmanbacteria bacterium]